MTHALKGLLRLPPWGFSGTEICFGPWFQDNFIVGICLDVGEGKGERGRATNDLAVLVILRSVARTPMISINRKLNASYRLQ